MSRGAKVSEEGGVASGWLSWPLVASSLRDALGVFRRHLFRIGLVGVVVFGVSAAVEQGLNGWVNRFPDASLPTLLVAIAITILLGGGTASFATLLFTGLLDYTVDADMEGRPAPPLATVLRRVPYLPLLGADVLVALITVAGTLLLVIPGLIAFTLLGLTGELVVAERLSPVAAMRLSFRLLRPRLGTALAVVLLPNLITGAIVQQLRDLAAHYSVVAGVAVGAVLDATLLAYAALLLNVLAYRLRERGEPDAIKLNREPGRLTVQDDG
jgi:hypothetical protein